MGHISEVDCVASHMWWGTEGTGQQIWSMLCCSVNIIQELRRTCQLNVMKIVLGWKVVSTWGRSAVFWKLPCLHHHSVMKQVSKTLGCCSELMQLIARGNQHWKNGSFSYSLLWYDYSVQRKQVSGVQLGKAYGNFNPYPANVENMVSSELCQQMADGM